MILGLRPDEDENVAQTAVQAVSDPFNVTVIALFEMLSTLRDTAREAAHRDGRRHQFNLAERLEAAAHALNGAAAYAVMDDADLGRP